MLEQRGLRIASALLTIAVQSAGAHQRHRALNRVFRNGFGCAQVFAKPQFIWLTHVGFLGVSGALGATKGVGYACSPFDQQVHRVVQAAFDHLSSLSLAKNLDLQFGSRYRKLRIEERKGDVLLHAVPVSARRDAANQWIPLVDRVA